MGRGKQVYQYDKYFNLIRVWNSISEVVKAKKWDGYEIAKCCNANDFKYKKYHAYYWSYYQL